MLLSNGEGEVSINAANLTAAAAAPPPPPPPQVDDVDSLGRQLFRQSSAPAAVSADPEVRRAEALTDPQARASALYQLAGNRLYPIARRLAGDAAAGTVTGRMLHPTPLGPRRVLELLAEHDHGDEAALCGYIRAAADAAGAGSGVGGDSGSGGGVGGGGGGGVDVSTASISQLKALIASAGLGHADCVEMDDLRARAREAQQKLRASAAFAALGRSAEVLSDEQQITKAGLR